MSGRLDTGAPPAEGDPVAAHVRRAVPTASSADSAAAAREALIGGGAGAGADVVVLDGGRPVGIVALERLLAADAEQSVGDLARQSGPGVVVTADTDQETAARLMASSGQRSLVVVDAAGGLVGLVAADRMLGVLVAEHDSDMARLGGYMAGTERARGAAEEPVGQRLWHRLPWLLVGVLGAMGSAVVVGAFDAQLEANVVVAFFVPAIVYMADAVGTQTETVLIRALAAGVSTRAIVARETITGVVMGTVVGSTFFAFVALGWGDVDVAVAVGIALVASCSMATLVAMALPSIFQSLGRDPAFGSGPLATVVQDVLSIVAYFAVVGAVA